MSTPQASPGLGLDWLEQELLEIERTFHSIADGELDRRLQKIYNGFGFRTSVLTPGMLIHRALDVHGDVPARPTNKSRVQYPPTTSKNGRLNRAGEVIFYGSPVIGAALMEIGCEPGKNYAVSHWMVHTPIHVAHCGYSENFMREMGTTRDLPKFAMPPDGFESGPFEILRRWHSRVFAQQVPLNEEYRYLLAIAIAHLFFGNNDPDGNLIGGILYPSVGLRGEADNIGLLRTEVDSKLSLFEVSFHLLEEKTRPDGRGVIYPIPTPLDFARPDTKGNLVWNQRSQLIPKPLNDIKVLLPE